MKQEGYSWNQSQKSKSGVIDRFVCSECGRKYKMQWARDKHQRLCKEFNKSRKKWE